MVLVALTVIVTVIYMDFLKTLEKEKDLSIFCFFGESGGCLFKKKKNRKKAALWKKKVEGLAAKGIGGCWINYFVFFNNLSKDGRGLLRRSFFPA